jgi:hypothetical protein
VAQRILQQLEMGDAVLADGDELPVDDRVGLYAFKRLRDLDVRVADDLSVAAVLMIFPLRL